MFNRYFKSKLYLSCFQTISDIVVHKHPDSPQVMGFEKKKKSIEHTYATLEPGISVYLQNSPIV